MVAETPKADTGNGSDDSDGGGDNGSGSHPESFEWGNGNGEVPRGQNVDGDGNIVNNGGSTPPGLNRRNQNAPDKDKNPDKPEIPENPGTEDSSDKNVNKAQQGTHIYCYSNPLRYWDPLGMSVLAADIFMVYGCNGLAATAGISVVPVAGAIIVTVVVAGIIIEWTGLDETIEDGVLSIADSISDFLTSKKNGNNRKDKNKKEQSKPSNKPYGSNKKANEQAQKQGFDDAHDLKEYYVGKNNVSKYDMKYNTKTQEIFLESKDGKIQIPTGLINKM